MTDDEPREVHDPTTCPIWLSADPEAVCTCAAGQVEEASARLLEVFGRVAPKTWRNTP